MKLLSFMFWKRVELKTNDDVKKKIISEKQQSHLTKAKMCCPHFKTTFKKFYTHKLCSQALHT